MRLISLTLLALPVVALASSGFETSSHKETSRNAASPYQASSALDSNLETAWVVNPSLGSKGQWIAIDVPRGKVDAVELVVGWAKTDETWTDHDRIKTARIEVIDLEKGIEGEVVHEQTVTLKDDKAPQLIDLPDVAVGGDIAGGRVKVVVEEVYKGMDYEYLAVSEALIIMDEFEAMTVNITEPPSSEAEGHDVSNATDDSSRTFWASEGEGAGSTLTFDGGKYSVSSIGITAGPKSYARPKTVRVTQYGVTVEKVLADKTSAQWIRLPALTGYTGSAVGPVTVEIVDTYAGSSSAVAISEVDFRATALELF